MSAPVTYIAEFLVGDAATQAYLTLRDELAWERRDTAPRSEYWTNTFGRPYTYGRGKGERTYESQPSHAIIDFLRDEIAAAHGPSLEGCFLNYYHDGSDALGWHADDDPGIDHDRPIAVITVGAGREIQFKSQVPGSHPQSQFLAPGSLLLMHPGMQQTHYHRIPRVDGMTEGRISLTYRGLVERPLREILASVDRLTGSIDATLDELEGRT